MCVFALRTRVCVCVCDSADSTSLLREALDYMAIACTCIHYQHHDPCGCSHTLLDNKKPSDCTWTLFNTYDF